MIWVPQGSIDVVESGVRWSSRGVDVQDVAGLSGQRPGSSVLFMTAAKKKSCEFAEKKLLKDLSTRFAIPKWLWQAKEQDYNGYFYGSPVPSQAEGDRPGHVSVFRFMIKYVTGTKPKAGQTSPEINYDWHVLTFVTYWNAAGTSNLLCFNVPSSFKQELKLALMHTDSDTLTLHPFVFHELVLEQVVELYDQAIWQFRDFVRDTERHRPTLDDPNPEYVAMHELARHTMHSSEVLATALSVMKNMLDEYERAQSTCQLQPAVHDPGPAIRHQRSMLQFMQNRSLALEGRLRNEINLALHITSQHANMLSAQIAQAAQVDSSAMKTISILGLLFLPGTFISALFSMSFFNYTQATSTSAASWSMSPKFWIYWVVAIPVTALTVATWWIWQKSLLTHDHPVGKKLHHRINPSHTSSTASATSKV